MWHWLTLNVWPTALRTTVSALTGGIVAVVIIAPMRGAFRLLRHRISSVLDSLDPDIPVGLTKQLDSMQGQLTDINKHVGGTLNVHPIHDPDRLEDHARGK